MKPGGPLRRVTPLRGYTELRRVTRLAPISRARLAELVEWGRIKELVAARDRGVCRAAGLVPGIDCTGGVDPHHRWPVGEGGKFLAPVEDVLSLCRRHHRWTHDENRVRATELGLIVRRRTR